MQTKNEKMNVGDGEFSQLMVRSEADLPLARDFIRRVKDELSLAEARMALVEVEATLARYPEVERFVFMGEWMSNDEGGSNFYMQVDVDLFDTFIPPPGWIARESDPEEAAGELMDALHDYGSLLDGESFERDKLLSELGERLMGADEFGAWMAWREAAAIGEATGPASGSGPKIRM